MSTHPAPGSAPCLLLESLQAVESQQAFCQHAATAMEAADAHVLAHALRFTARQEAEQAAILRAMTPPCAPAPAPESLPVTPEEILRTAIAREEASCQLLSAAAQACQADDQPRTADALLRIAETQSTHARRFRQCLQSLTDGSLLRSPRRVSWFCLGCGALHHSCDAPSACEGCGRSQSHFIRSSFFPLACR